MTAASDLQKILDGYSIGFDEPATLDFLVALRKEGVLSDENWRRILQLLASAMEELSRPEPEGDGKDAINLDADPRNDDWIRIVGARRRAGYRMPSRASLWLWWISFDREDAAFWQQVGRVAEKREFAEFL